ncbi:Epithelial membrane protein 3 [Bagarius yarrelli]|uniref:Epithelial membrane protein 3 n=1 Tax=Bagarius yarrelli TaxID=175774 RepID=A0A556V4H6_BAGYA|nr:Epithelial membrane protein 3 [Bagarius yarrelli]
MTRRGEERRGQKRGIPSRLLNSYTFEGVHSTSQDGFLVNNRDASAFDHTGDGVHRHYGKDVLTLRPFTAIQSWWAWDSVKQADLWHKCIYDNTTDTLMCTSASENDWLQSVQALMVLSVILSSISFVVFICQLFTTSRRGLFYFSGLSQIFAGIATFAAVLIYTFQRKEILQDPRELTNGQFGYCYILAWVCVPLLLSSGVLYVHLRKKAHTAA